jgi:GAF domain-containing protein
MKPKEDEKKYFSSFIVVSKAISSSLDLNEVLDLIITQAVEFLGVKAGAITLWDKRMNRLQLIAHRNLSQDFVNKGPVLADKSIPDTIIHKKPMVVSNIEKDPRVQYPDDCKREGIQSILSMPIVFKGNVIGVLRLYDSTPRDYSAEQLEFINALAEQGGIAIENARYVEHIKKEHEKEMQEVWDWFAENYQTPPPDG